MKTVRVMKFDIGHRVAVYSGGLRYIGIVLFVNNEGLLDVQLGGASVLRVSPQQCRRLKPCVKSRGYNEAIDDVAKLMLTHGYSDKPGAIIDGIRKLRKST